MNAAWWWLGLTLAGEHGAWSWGWEDCIPENRPDLGSGEYLGGWGSGFNQMLDEMPRAKPVGRELNSASKKGESPGDEEWHFDFPQAVPMRDQDYQWHME